MNERLPNTDFTQEIRDEIDLFEATVKKFLAMEITPETFQRFRLQHGIYGQRQDGVQMCRIKIPLGILDAGQIECIAGMAESIAHNNAHLTTRQDIQIHYVQLENTPMLMRRLAEVGLTTRESCGNTIRNVTASPSAGVDPGEAFDVTPYAHALAYHLLRNPLNQNLPRKFKVAFDGGGVFTALPLMHDLGLIAKARDGKRGFEVYAGGGLGASPRVAKLLYDFLPVEELIPLTHAMLQVFDRYGERKIRMKARMKFLIDKWGFEKFRETVAKETKEIKVDPEWNEFLGHLEDWEEKSPAVDGTKIPKGTETSEFLNWKQSNVTSQKQKGYSIVEVRLSNGDMIPKQMRALADILRRYVGGRCRLMVHQNLLIRWVRDQDLPALYQELKTIDFTKRDPQTVYDVTACPGTDTCRLGIASSTGLARALEKRLYQEDEASNLALPVASAGAWGPSEAAGSEDANSILGRRTGPPIGKVAAIAKEIRIKIGGCPNACGQHHIANIGFYGGAFPIDGHTLPAFQLLLGGDPGREMALATPICQIPSMNIPDAAVRLISQYTEKKKTGESFNSFYDRLGKEAVISLLGKLLDHPKYEEKPEFYTDWEDKKEFALQKGVIGECAGAMVDAVVPNVKDGEAPLQMAEAHMQHAQFESVAHKAYEAICKAANGLLYQRLIQPFSNPETTHEFENQFVKTGIMPEWRDFHERVEGLRKKGADAAVAKEWLDLATKFLKGCKKSL